MATIQTVNNGDSGLDARNKINQNDNNLNAEVSLNTSKLATIETGATADQTDAEIETAYSNQVPQVSALEKTNRTELAVRRFSPKDIADMVDAITGLLSNLTTTDKTNLVAAINEVRSSLSGLDYLTDEDIDTLAELNAILIDANLLSASNNLSDLTDASAARTNIGLGNVDNTSDADKPISTAQQAVFDLKAEKPTASALTDGSSISWDWGSVFFDLATLTTTNTAITLTLSNVVAGSNQILSVVKNTASDVTISLAGTGLSFYGYDSSDYGTTPNVVLSGASGDIFDISFLARTATNIGVAIGRNGN